jgi:hypothetical protein
MSGQGGDDVVETTTVVIEESTKAVGGRQGWKTSLFGCCDDGCDACT